MFGYVRPLKPELRVREYTRYRAVYCGLCRQIRLDYGQLPRLSVSYDLTFLALLLLALSESQPDEQQAGCILNPFVRKPMVKGGTILTHCAALSVLLAWHKAADQARDEHPLAGRLASLAFAGAHRRAAMRYPGYEQVIRSAMADLQEAERQQPDVASARIFGDLLQQLIQQIAATTVPEGPIRAALGFLGQDLGRWIYLIDAIDDWQDDCNNKTWNPFGLCRSFSAAKEQAEPLLLELERALDRTAALLPYVRDSGLMVNLFTLGLPAVRQQVFAGVHPARL